MMCTYQLINARQRQSHKWGVALTTIREMQGPGCIAGTKRCHAGWLSADPPARADTHIVWDFLMKSNAVAFGVVYAIELLQGDDVEGEGDVFSGKIHWLGWSL